MSISIDVFSDYIGRFEQNITNSDNPKLDETLEPSLGRWSKTFRHE